MTQDSPHLRLDLPGEARHGATVPIVLRVENLGDRPLELHLRGREIAFDVVVSRSDGEVVWRRLAGEIIPAVLQLRTLAPREALELRALWGQRTNRGHLVDPGLYSVRAMLLTDEPTPLETPTTDLLIADS